MIAASHGGKNTKIHAAVNGDVLPVALTFTDGKTSDKTQIFDLVEAAEVPVGSEILADRGYSYYNVHDVLEKMGFDVCIPTKVSHRNPWSWDFGKYKSRNVVERFFCKLKQYRAVATRYAKRITLFKGLVYLACILIIFHKILN